MIIEYYLLYLIVDTLGQSFVNPRYVNLVIEVDYLVFFALRNIFRGPNFSVFLAVFHATGVGTSQRVILMMRIVETFLIAIKLGIIT